MSPHLARLLGSSGLFALLTLGCSSSSPDPAPPAAGGGASGAGAGGAAGASGMGGASGSGPAAVGPLGAALSVDKQVQVAGLAGPVDVVQDKYGRPHIYATSMNDAMRVEGYLTARDRHMQLDIVRRLSEGRLAELLGDVRPELVDNDITYRFIGLARVAKLEYDALQPGELKDAIDAYADGITQAFHDIKSRKIPIPPDVYNQIADALTDWTGVDTFAIGRLQTYNLSYDGDSDMAFTATFQALRATFGASASDPLAKKRAGLERDLFRFAPAAPAVTDQTMMFPGQTAMLKGRKAGPRPRAAPFETRIAVGEMTESYRAAVRRGRDMIAPYGFGSNSFLVQGSRSTTGHALVASDPHLGLSAPAVFWPVSIDVTAPPGGDAAGDLHVGGLSFPGIPGIILGHNAHIAWGATTAEYDVTDVYAEKLTPDGGSVMFKGAPVPLQTIPEVINIAGSAPYTYNVQVVPHHGPLQPNIQGHKVLPPDPAKGALSVKWTGHSPSGEIVAAFGLLRARDVDQARAALNSFGVGAQNWMVGDDQGNILWSSHALLPVRDKGAYAWDAAKYTGTLPIFVLPGDGSAEWTGKYLPDDLVPWRKNPAKGYLANSNNDGIGVTLDNDPSSKKLPDGTPVYLAPFFDLGLREQRITALLDARAGMISPDDMAAIQNDHRSAMGARLTSALLAAIDRAESERLKAGAAPDMAAVAKDPAYDPAKIARVRGLLDGWGKASDYAAASGVDPDTNTPLPASGATQQEVEASQATLIFNDWLQRAVHRALGDELHAAGDPPYDNDFEAKAFLYLVETDPAKLATYDAATKQSALWDDMTTPEVESQGDRFVRALLDALADIDAGGGLDAARWGAVHTIQFGALLPTLGATLSIPPDGDPTFPSGFPRPGDNFNVDAASFGVQNGGGKSLGFGYGDGPTQRFVADVDPAGVKVKNCLPGGNVWNNKSPHFRDEAEYWRKNQTHEVPFAIADVIADKESRIVVSSP